MPNVHDDDEETLLFADESEWMDSGQSADNHVYVMECGHEYDSSFRRSEGVIVTCSMHGPTRLVSGDFL